MLAGHGRSQRDRCLKSGDAAHAQRLLCGLLNARAAPLGDQRARDAQPRIDRAHVGDLTADLAAPWSEKPSSSTGMMISSAAPSAATVAAL